MVAKKHKSKRCSFKDKYKVQKKVREHRKKMRKISRTSGKQFKTAKKDPGIPNLFPFKQALLQRMSEAKLKSEEIERKQKEARKERLAQSRIEIETKKEEAATQSHSLQQKGNYKKWFMKDLKQLLEVSDVILEVLDARDPLGCRCRKIEEMIQGQYSASSSRPKRIILVLNKIDLVPREAVVQWVKYLRREFACVAFKASTQQQKGNLAERKVGSAGEASKASLQGGSSVGGQALIQLLKNYSRSHDIKTAITVGIIGYPNVGKSSLINSLKRARAVGVGAQPGFTKQCQMVKLDKQISLIDSPGVLFDADTSDPGLSLRNCLKVENIEDPVGAVKEIVKRCGKPLLLSLYRIANFTNGDEFLYRVAQKRGKLSKGGVPDMPAAARCVLRDWNSGKIPFYTLPPEEKSEFNSVQIKDMFSKEFDLDKINENNIKSLGPGSSEGFMMLEKVSVDEKIKEKKEAVFLTQEIHELNKHREEKNRMMMENDEIDDEIENQSVATKATSASRASTRRKKKSFQAIDNEINPQTNKHRRRQQKAQQKAKMKGLQKSSTSGSNEMNAEYTFDDHMWN